MALHTLIDNPALMLCYDKINKKYGAGVIHIASQGFTPRNQKWQMRREFLSPSYTSKWCDIPKIICWEYDMCGRFSVVYKIGTSVSNLFNTHFNVMTNNNFSPSQVAATITANQSGYQQVNAA